MKLFPFMWLKMFPGNVLRGLLAKSHGTTTRVEDAQRARIKSHMLGSYLKKKKIGRKRNVNLEIHSFIQLDTSKLDFGGSQNFPDHTLHDFAGVCFSSESR